ncbi:MAG: type IV pilus twitching motility protein PilT [Pirellula sp.]|jgi:twitching motility protein PilT
MQHVVNDTLRDWLQQITVRNASDLHLISGYPPASRQQGRMHFLDHPKLSDLDIRNLITGIVPQELLESFHSAKNADLAACVQVNGFDYRLRINLFLNQGQLGVCMRIIPDQIPDFAWSSFPIDTANKLCSFQDGLVLCTGITGSGKSTTLAMLVDRLCQQGGKRIVTIEDPIELQIQPKNGSIVTQRELGCDLDSFADGLKFALRQDPDVILIGEIRDCESARLALTAAETGHLVLSTMHTRDAKGAISRYTDLFPSTLQQEARSMLAYSLRAIVCQRLVPSPVPDEPQDLALEIMYNTAPIAAAIRNGKFETIDNYILTGRNDGMITMDESLRRLKLT